MLDTTLVTKKIDNVIKKIWLSDIKQDYSQKSLLKEDSLKNAFYYHLRRRLGDNFLLENRLRIYTEYHYNGLRADLVIVRLVKEPGMNGHLQNDVEDIISVIEMKYKYDLSEKPFLSDIRKVRKNIIEHKIDAQFYLAFIHEVEYEDCDNKGWLTSKDLRWANGKVTELNGYFIEGQAEATWEIISYNQLN